MMQYSDNNIKESRRKGLIEIRQKYVKSGVPYNMAGRITYLVRHHMGNKASNPILSPDLKLARATGEQQQTGLYLLSRGFLVKMWYAVIMGRRTDKSE